MTKSRMSLETMFRLRDTPYYRIRIYYKDPLLLRILLTLYCWWKGDL